MVFESSWKVLEFDFNKWARIITERIQFFSLCVKFKQYSFVSGLCLVMVLSLKSSKFVYKNTQLGSSLISSAQFVPCRSLGGDSGALCWQNTARLYFITANQVYTTTAYMWQLLVAIRHHMFSLLGSITKSASDVGYCNGCFYREVCLSVCHTPAVC